MIIGTIMAVFMLVVARHYTSLIIKSKLRQNQCETENSNANGMQVYDMKWLIC